MYRIFHKIILKSLKKHYLLRLKLVKNVIRADIINEVKGLFQ